MATIKMNYMVQSCPVCGKRLLKVAQGAQLIGSPLITCNHCGKTYRTDLRVEWVDYGQKWQLWGIPLLVPALMFVLGAIMANAALGIMAAILGLIIALCISGKDVVRMIKSKKRMNDPAYIQKLFEYGVITEFQRDDYLKNAK